LTSQAPQREGKKAKTYLVRRARLGQVLGVSQARALKWTERGDFPAPVMWLEARPVWELADLKRWAKERTFG
jgi:predicted DNA-binding transcriptional regulator AlpA